MTCKSIHETGISTSNCTLISRLTKLPTPTMKRPPIALDPSDLLSQHLGPSVWLNSSIPHHTMSLHSKFRNRVASAKPKYMIVPFVITLDQIRFVFLSCHPLQGHGGSNHMWVGPGWAPPNTNLFLQSYLPNSKCRTHVTCRTL